MVRASFVPPLAIRQLRNLTRYRKTQIDARVAEIQRLEKAHHEEVASGPHHPTLDMDHTASGLDVDVHVAAA